MMTRSHVNPGMQTGRTAFGRRDQIDRHQIGRATGKHIGMAPCESTLDLGHDAPRIRRMLDAFRAGDLYREAEEAPLDALRARVLGTLSDRVPGYRQIALTRNTEDFWFEDEDLEGIRRIWESLRLFRRLRRHVLDELAAEYQIAALRGRRVAVPAD